MTTRITHIAFALSVAGILSACAHQVPATPDPAAIATATSKAPLNVGIYFPAAFVNFQHSESKWGDVWNFDNLGVASMNQMRDAFEKNFVTVVKLDARATPAEMAAKQLDVLVVPEITGYSFDIPLTKFQVYPATISYKINVYDANLNDTPVMADGVGDTSGSPGFDFSTNPSKSASKAIEVGVNNAVAGVRATPLVQSRIASPAR